MHLDFPFQALQPQPSVAGQENGIQLKRQEQGGLIVSVLLTPSGREAGEAAVWAHETINACAPALECGAEG
jgi:hypothetical protein